MWDTGIPLGKDNPSNKQHFFVHIIKIPTIKQLNCKPPRIFDEADGLKFELNK